jgi:oligoribonuclease
MTGLAPETSAILEAAVIITGPDLVPLGEFERVVWQPEEVLLRTEPIVRSMHEANGLFHEVRASPYSLEMVEREVMKLVVQHCQLGEAVLCGNSIHTDRRFLRHHMPMVERYLHHRMVDVSSFRVVVHAWQPAKAHLPGGPSRHRAMADLRGSLAELAQYRAAFFA